MLFEWFYNYVWLIQPLIKPLSAFAGFILAEVTPQQPPVSAMPALPDFNAFFQDFVWGGGVLFNAIDSFSDFDYALLPRIDYHG